VKDYLSKGIFPMLGVLAVASIVSYLLFFGPKLREVRRLQAEVTAKELEMGRSLQTWSAIARTPGDETRRWEERVLEWREKVPETPDTDRLMSEIVKEAVSHNLRGFRLTIPADGKAEKSGMAEGPGAATEEKESDKVKEFGEIRLHLSFFSTYRDMAELVEGIPKMRRLLAIRALTVKEKDGEMETVLELSAFHRKQ
jgi:Tfp pilus assembly protein PilO